jgi:hypothetical protein
MNVPWQSTSSLSYSPATTDSPGSSTQRGHTVIGGNSRSGTSELEGVEISSEKVTDKVRPSRLYASKGSVLLTVGGAELRYLSWSGPSFAEFKPHSAES